MSVDDRLRAGLAANAGVVVPEGEARLVAVRSRHRRRIMSLSVAGVGVVAAAAVLAVAVTGGADRAAPPDSVQPAGTATVPAVGLIPDSTWRKVVTVARARDEGVSEQRIREDIGDDGRLPIEMRLEDGRFTQTGDFGGSVWEIGDSGTVTYDDRGRLVATSVQCGGCPALSFTWRIDGRRLVVSGMDPDSGPMARAVWLGTWRRTD